MINRNFFGIEFESDFQYSIFSQVLIEFGSGRALEVLENWEEYKDRFIVNGEILEEFNKIKLSNIKNLQEVHNTGEYFNIKKSYFSSSKDGYLKFENIESGTEFKTMVHFSEFKEYAKQNKEELAEILIYIDTSSQEQMDIIITATSINDILKYAL